MVGIGVDRPVRLCESLRTRGVRGGINESFRYRNLPEPVSVRFRIALRDRYTDETRLRRFEPIGERTDIGIVLGIRGIVKFGDFRPVCIIR